jgi:hypothetical protein
MEEWRQLVEDAEKQHALITLRRERWHVANEQRGTGDDDEAGPSNAPPGS